MNDPHISNVVSLLNFSGMPDGNTITDFVTGTSWDVPVGSSVVSGGKLVLANNGDYIRQIDDETGLRDFFNGASSKKFTIEGKIVVKKVAQNPWFGWRAATNATGMVLQQSAADTDESRYTAGDASYSGWEVDIESSALGIAVDDEIEYCVQRDEGAFYLHINGDLKASDTGHESLILALGSGGLRIGKLNAGNAVDAHIEVKRFRMTKDVARYGSANYTPVVGDDYPEDPGPLFPVQPDNVSVWEGDRAQFSLLSTGTGPLSYQWYRDGLPVGDDSPIYVTDPTVAGDDGDEVYCDVTDDFGTNSSDTVILSVIEPAEYPNGYPIPTWSYSRQISPTARRTAFDSGWVRQRRQFNTFPETVQLNFRMSTEVFETWFDWVIQNAYGWFELPTDRFSGVTGTEVARFTSELRYSYDEHDRVTVSVMGEVRNA
jgi:hypothetical protein